MSAMTTSSVSRPWRALPWLGALLLFSLATAALAQNQADPPGRVAYVSASEGSVVFAPEGEDEWAQLPANRPLTSGDRLWSDRGARAELQLGSATLHMDGESHLGLAQLDERAAQFMLQQGVVNARVRELTQGENFEIGTPNIAFRALQPGDYRIDVDTQTQQTRVVVLNGLAAVYGEGGQSIQMGAGQQAVFAGRFLAQVQAPPFRQDAFGQWAAERNRVEDQSLAARHVPRGVVGYSQLDAYGSWGQDPAYGAVWYPRVVVQDWAPYRYGHWSWIAPWGWTWIDDAPWGFAPFHYGRWTMIGPRWAWVPGHLAVRPVYSPALVVFLGGGGSQFSLTVGSGPGVGWYPLAPGEAWWPVYRTSPRYVSYANYNINLQAYPRHYSNHVWRTRPQALTAVREDDFRRGRPVYRHWQPVEPSAVGRAQVGVVPARPEPRYSRLDREAPRGLHSTPPAAVQPGMPQRYWGNRGELPPAVRDQARAQREQDRLQRDAERAAREQIRQQDPQRGDRDQRGPREQIQRQQTDAARMQQERAQREGWQQRQHQEQVQRQQEQVQRQQDQVQRQQEQSQRQQLDRAQREAGQRAQQERAQREAAQQQRQQQEQVQRQQEQVQVQRQQQERGQREAWQQQRQQERAAREQQQQRAAREQERAQGQQPQGFNRGGQPQPVVQQPPQAQPQAPQVRERHQRGPDARGEGRGPREGDEGRGRGQGRGRD